jgi:hypothetical protein
MAPPRQSIFRQDHEREESFEEAVLSGDGGDLLVELHDRAERTYDPRRQQGV